MERRRFTREFKLEAVRLIKERGVSYAQASQDLGVHQSQLRSWVKALADDRQHAFPGQGRMKPEQLDFKGDARTSGERRRREGGNIFGDQIKVGIAISFFVKKHGTTGCRVSYQAVRDHAKLDEKVDFLREGRIESRQFLELKTDVSGNWIPIAESNFSTFIPIASKETKAVKIAAQERAVFKLYSLGVSTNRDAWLYDFNKSTLEAKMKFFIREYDKLPRDASEFPTVIKWSRNLKRRLAHNLKEPYISKQIVRANYRPFVPRWFYQSQLFIDESGSADEMFPTGCRNTSICFSDVGSRTDYCLLAVGGLADLHFGAAVDAYQQVSRYRFINGERIDNITDWALDQFRAHYEKHEGAKRAITKDAIFYYVYGVLHDPIYGEKYAMNLKREFPRIPFYADFWKWADWGEKLMALHITYETVEPWPLARVDTPDDKSRKAELALKVMLRADKKVGNIQLDSETQLTGVPAGSLDVQARQPFCTRMDSRSVQGKDAEGSNHSGKVQHLPFRGS